MFKQTSGQKVIVIVGPTASGKSDLALRLAKWLRLGRIARQFGVKGAEIISADSRQVYRGMNIGTGKILQNKIKKSKKSPSYLHYDRSITTVSNNSVKSKHTYISSGVPHHLVDIASPKKQFSADDFKKLGRKALDDIVSRGKIPIIVGGTGFYIDVLLGRMSVSEVPPNPKLRTKLEKQSAEQLFEQLKKLDPERSRTIEEKNKRRLIRALEIIAGIGKPIPAISARHLAISKPKVLWIGIKPKDLEKRIKIRLDKRLRQGMIKEVQKLHQGGVGWKRLDEFGLEYRWISKYLKTLSVKRLALGTKNFEQSTYYQGLLREIIKYSKRQMTWFKKNKEINWINPPKGGQKETERTVRKFLING